MSIELNCLSLLRNTLTLTARLDLILLRNTLTLTARLDLSLLRHTHFDRTTWPFKKYTHFDRTTWEPWPVQRRLRGREHSDTEHCCPCGSQLSSSSFSSCPGYQWWGRGRRACQSSWCAGRPSRPPGGCLAVEPPRPDSPSNPYYPRHGLLPVQSKPKNILLVLYITYIAYIHSKVLSTTI